MPRLDERAVRRPRPAGEIARAYVALYAFGLAAAAAPAGAGCDQGSACADCDADQAPAAGGGGASGAAASAGAGAGGGGGSVDGGAADDAGGGASHEPVPAGACVPEGPDADELGARRTVLYTGSRALRAVAVRRGIVYAADEDDGLLRMAEGAAEFERIAAANTAEFLVGDLNMYWYEDGAAWKASLSGTDAMPDRIVQGLPAPIALRAFDQTQLYAVSETQRTITTFAIAGGDVTTLASGVSVRDLELHAGDLYYAELGAGHVLRLSAEGGEPERLTSKASTALGAVATDGSALYWVDGIAIYSASLDDVAERVAIGVAGPAAQGGRSHVLQMQRDEERLYWSDRDGNLGWTALDGSACALIAAGVSELHAWDTDATTVYATVGAGTTSELWRIAQ